MNLDRSLGDLGIFETLGQLGNKTPSYERLQGPGNESGARRNRMKYFIRSTPTCL